MPFKLFLRKLEKFGIILKNFEISSIFSHNFKILYLKFCIELNNKIVITFIFESGSKFFIINKDTRHDKYSNSIKLILKNFHTQNKPQGLPHYSHILCVCASILFINETYTYVYRVYCKCSDIHLNVEKILYWQMIHE